MARKPITLVIASFNLRYQIFPDGEIEVVPPEPAAVIPIDCRPPHASLKRRTEIVRRAVKALPKEALPLLKNALAARKEQRKPSPEEKTVIRALLTELARVCQPEGLRFLMS